MSLNRVTSLETWEYHPISFRHQERSRRRSTEAAADEEEGNLPFGARRASSVASTTSQSSKRRKLNFNPAAGPSWTHASIDDSDEYQPSEHSGSDDSVLISSHEVWEEPDISAPFEVSKAKRIAQVCAAVAYCVLSAGVTFGFAALKPVLIEEGVYRDRCTQDETERGELLCYNQDLRLNLMFTLAAVISNISALPVGTILDACGPRVSGIIGSILIALGSASLSVASMLPFDAYAPGYFILALGGPFVYISTFHLSNTFPSHSGLILATLTGAFDASSALFLLFRVLHGGFFSLRNLFLFYLIVPALIVACQIFLMPSTSYKTIGELIQQADDLLTRHETDDNAEQEQQEEPTTNAQEQNQRVQNRAIQRQNALSKIQTLLDPNSNNPQNTPPTPSQKPLNKNSIYGVLHMASAIQQVRSPWFILMALFTTIQMLRINYFIATINLQYTHLLSSPNLATRLNNLFDIFLPTAGVLAVPFIGLILDKTTTTTVLTSLVGGATLIGILGCIRHSIPAAYANITLFTLYRPLFYAAISDYSAKVFGFQTFGKVYGLLVCIAGVGNFGQVPLDVLTFRVFGRDPVPVNILLAVVGFVVGGMLVLFVGWEGRERSGVLDVVVENGEGGVGVGGEGGMRRRGSSYARGMGETDRLIGGGGSRWEGSGGAAMYGAVRGS
ncbi:hypothetical protein FQN51_003083 [Onygenales sp. PD_10]|nr:hypothetical protein FQN51_003083 [Onygenales sp. PD_10]